MPDMAMDARTIGFCAAALALTLVLAAWLTPRGWWRRPNLRALAVLGGGTLALGTLFAVLSGAQPGALPGVSAGGGHAPASPVPATALADPLAGAPQTARPTQGAAYLVIDDLNLRTHNGVRGERIAVLAAGSRVTATGAAQGDWWQVRAQVGGHAREGWASSLWLRRADERRRR